MSHLDIGRLDRMLADPVLHSVDHIRSELKAVAGNKLALALVTKSRAQAAFVYICRAVQAGIPVGVAVSTVIHGKDEAVVDGSCC
jgi:hypothetical protein